MSGIKPNPAFFTKLSIFHVINKAIREYGYKSEKEKRRIICSISKEDDFFFKGDENLMIYVIFNLLKNALYYSNTHPNLTITINSKTTAEEDKNHNHIYITDNGPGIAPNLLPHLFEDFMTSNKQGGTGLGLAFCKRVMTSFNGSISCSSKENEGTAFKLKFPKTNQN